MRPQSYFIDTANEAPYGLSLSSPVDGSTIAELVPTLEANNAVDPEGQTLTYDFQIDVTNTFSSDAALDAIGIEEGTGGVTHLATFGIDGQHYLLLARSRQ